MDWRACDALWVGACVVTFHSAVAFSERGWGGPADWPYDHTDNKGPHTHTRTHPVIIVIGCLVTPGGVL